MGGLCLLTREHTFAPKWPWTVKKKKTKKNKTHTHTQKYVLGHKIKTSLKGSDFTGHILLL